MPFFKKWYIRRHYYRHNFGGCLVMNTSPFVCTWSCTQQHVLLFLRRHWQRRNNISTRCTAKNSKDYIFHVTRQMAFTYVRQLFTAGLFGVSCGIATGEPEGWLLALAMATIKIPSRYQGGLREPFRLRRVSKALVKCLAAKIP